MCAGNILYLYLTMGFKNVYICQMSSTVHLSSLHFNVYQICLYKKDVLNKVIRYKRKEESQICKCIYGKWDGEQRLVRDGLRAIDVS